MKRRPVPDPRIHRRRRPCTTLRHNRSRPTRGHPALWQDLARPDLASLARQYAVSHSGGVEEAGCQLDAGT